jgi:hypothetical protein
VLFVFFAADLALLAVSLLTVGLGAYGRAGSSN